MVEILLLNVSGESKCMTKWQFLLIYEKKMVTIKLFLFNFSGGSKCVTKWQFLLIL